MDPRFWLLNRRWMWRAIVLLAMLGMLGLLVWRGADPLDALGVTVVIFMVAAVVIGLFFNDPPPAPPAAVSGEAPSSPIHSEIAALVADALDGQPAGGLVPRAELPATQPASEAAQP